MINKCPNISSPQAKEVISKVGLVEFYKLYRENGEEIPEPSTVKPSLGNVDFSLKVINALQNPKTISLYNKFFKNNPSKFYAELQLLGTPKEQLNMLKEFNASNPSASLDEMISGIGAQFLYPVEIETTYTQERQAFTQEEIEIYEDFSTEEGGLPNYDYKPSTSTSYYANLTVPGGTNYRENEIKTPFITPSIKGHAQFATSEGIGWFRSDDKRIDDNTGKLIPDGAGGLVQLGQVTDSKTRRILELQSDLFQKGRDKEELVNTIEKVIYKGEEFEVVAHLANGNIQLQRPDSIELYDGPIVKPSEIESKINNQNQFLQLLNKDGNWINFFVKSIVNDSIKRGYEEVWFPSGNTASKVEGHTTLEDFKEEKNSRIRRLEGDNIRLKDRIEREKYLGYVLTTDEDQIIKNKQEISQLEKELVDVESEGIAKLKPIYTFYEQRLKNILEKTYSSTQVTDEYGNTWNKVDLSKINDQKILLQLDQSESTSSKANEVSLKVIKDFNSRIGVITESVAEIVVNGQRIGANGIALPYQNLIQVVYGKENVALAEESMHIAVELLEQKNPKLFNEMLNKIGNYNLYKSVFNEYSKNLLYQKDDKPDIRKIKKEAIGKILAETLIERVEGVTEKPELLAQSQKWWNEILDWLKSLFNKAGFNPFVTFASSIVEGKEDLQGVQLSEDTAYAQLVPNEAVDNIFNKIQDTNNKLAKLGQGTEDRHYEISGQRIKESVTEKIKRMSPPFKDRTEYEKFVDAEYAKWGDNGHKDAEYILKSNFDENGYLRDSQDDDSSYTSLLQPNDRELYNILKTYIREKLETYPPGTRFMSEIMGYDGKDLAGTLDFIAIIPDGASFKVDILDWKFKSLNTDRWNDIPWYSIKSWNAQMDEYRKLLQTYGIKPSQFRNTRMIPIIIDYENVNDQDFKEGKIPTKIQIGNNKVNIEGKAYLLPVPTISEAIQDKRLDPLITKLRGLYERWSKIPVEEHKKALKNAELNNLFSTIRQLQVRGNLTPLLEQAKLLNESVKRVLSKYEKVEEELDLIPIEEISKRNKFKSDYINKIGQAIGNLSIYTNLATDLKEVFEGELTEEEKELRKAIKDASEDARDLLADVQKLDKKIVQKWTVEGRVDDDVLLPEVPRNVLQRNVVSLSEQGTVNAQTLSKISAEIHAQTIIDRDEERTKIDAIEKDYLAWAKTQGLKGIKEIFSPLIKPGTHSFIDEIDKKFYDELTKRIAAKDEQWLNENIDMAAYKEKIKEIRKNLLLDIEESGYTESDKDKKRIDIQNDFSLAKGGDGLFIRRHLKDFVIKEKWYSKEQLEIMKHPAALAALNYFKGRNEWMKDVGYLTEFQVPRSFIPYSLKSWLEGLQTGTNISLIERTIQQFTVTENDTAYGAIDKVTGRVMDIVPKFFITDNAPNLLDSEGKPVRDEKGKIVKDYTDYSTDLFKLYDLMNATSLKWKYTTDVEAQALQLHRIEENKHSILTTTFGAVKVKEGRDGTVLDDLELSPSNEVNTKFLGDMIKATIYGQRYVENNDAAFGNLNKVQKIAYILGKKFNNLLGKETLPEKEYLERKMSVYKTIDTVNRAFRYKLLGGNVLTGSINFLGGSAQNLINSGRVFTSKEYLKDGITLLSKRFKGEEGKVLTALLDRFAPMLDDQNRRRNKELSATAINRFYLSDTLLVLQTAGDEFIQNNIAISMLRNAIIVDGEIVNLREYVRGLPEYTRRYDPSVSQEERKTLEKEMKAKMIELEETQSLFKISKIVDDKLVIPGLSDNRKEATSLAYRSRIQQIAKDATGNMSDDDRRGLNLSVFGTSFMMFKNWIPRLVAVRYTGLSQVRAGDAYEWGRTRIVAHILFTQTKFSLKTLRGMMVGNDVGVAALRKLYDKKKLDYFNKTGKELKMEPEEFFDMVREGIRSQYRDSLALLSLVGMMLAAKALPPDDDEDKHVTNFYKFSLRGIDKLQDELRFYYNPLEAQQILNGSVFPALGSITSAVKMLENIAQEGFGFALGEAGFSYGDELQESAHPIKYTMKTFRIANQMVNYLPIFYPDLAKELDIEMQTQSRSR